LLLENKQYLTQIATMMEQSDIPWNELDQKSVLVSGAAGMLGSGVVDVLVYCNEYRSMNIDIYALGRTGSKIKNRYGKYCEKPYFNVVEADVSKPFSFDFHVDYIIHAASNANPYMYANYPVDTLLANVVGTNNFLEYARNHGTKRMLYVSSGEMYGQPDDKLVDGFSEDYCGVVNYADSRSCYPAGKRAAETLCQSYISQYGVESVIVRPCHCYGPTQSESDSRAMSQFIRKVLNGEDIVLKSDGSLERTHCYILDAVQAMFLVLFKAANGEAYNIADNGSDASIREVAEIISGAKNKKVVFDLPDCVEKKGFSKVTRAVLSGRKLMSLGWKPIWNLKTGIAGTLEILDTDNC
jgi:nucleoside-diphosphate-sugar epimerase